VSTIELSAFYPITDVTYEPNSTSIIPCFHLKVKNIAFIGQQKIIIAGTTFPNPLDSGQPNVVALDRVSPLTHFPYTKRSVNK